MKTLIIAISILLTGCSSLGDPFYKFGLWHKLNEADISRSVNCNSGFSVHAQVGFDVNGLSYGIGHISDLKCGRPFRDDIEYGNNHVFIEYKGTL